MLTHVAPEYHLVTAILKNQEVLPDFVEKLLAAERDLKKKVEEQVTRRKMLWHQTQDRLRVPDRGPDVLIVDELDIFARLEPAKNEEARRRDWQGRTGSETRRLGSRKLESGISQRRTEGLQHEGQRR